MHVHVGAMSTLITALEVIVVIGTLNLIAMKFPHNPLAASWLNLMNAQHN